MFDIRSKTITCTECNETKSFENYYMIQAIDEERIYDEAIRGCMKRVEDLKGPRLYKTCKNCYRKRIIEVE